MHLCHKGPLKSGRNGEEFLNKQASYWAGLSARKAQVTAVYNMCDNINGSGSLIMKYIAYIGFPCI